MRWLIVIAVSLMVAVLVSKFTNPIMKQGRISGDIAQEAAGDIRSLGYNCPTVKRQSFCQYKHGLLIQLRCGPDDDTDKVNDDQIYGALSDNRRPVGEFHRYEPGEEPPRNPVKRWAGAPDSCPDDPFPATYTAK